MEIARMANALSKSWSVESSKKWSRDNPSAGQCGVTALVVNDLLGDEIKKLNYLMGGTFIFLLITKDMISQVLNLEKEFYIWTLPLIEMKHLKILMKVNTPDLKQKVLDSLFY